MKYLRWVICGCLLGACAQDGDLLYVRAAAAQPDDPNYGRLLSVFASSGDDTHDSKLQIHVLGGTLKSADLPTTTDPIPQICVVVPRGALHEEKIAVVPTASEVLVVAILRDQGSGCTGTTRTQIIVPVQRVGEQTALGGDDAGGTQRAAEVAP